MRTHLAQLAFFIVTLHALCAHAADPAVKCQTGKLKVAGNYGRCRVATLSTALKKGTAADYTKCAGKFSSKWQGLESSGACPTTGDAGTAESLVIDHIVNLDLLMSAELSFVCAFPASGQTASFGNGDDGDVRAGAPLSYRDNGDGTITDLNTGLMWEKKVGLDGFAPQCTDASGLCANPHDADNTYTWTTDAPLFNGSVVHVFLNQLNNRCHSDVTVPCSSSSDCARINELDTRCGFAGYRDWRLPNQKELHSIISRARTVPTSTPTAFHAAGCHSSCTNVNDATCSCTRNGFYWSSTTTSGATDKSWMLHFGSGEAFPFIKQGFNFARAVRGGL